MNPRDRRNLKNCGSCKNISSLLNSVPEEFISFFSKMIIHLSENLSLENQEELAISISESVIKPTSIRHKEGVFRALGYEINIQLKPSLLHKLKKKISSYLSAPTRSTALSISDGVISENYSKALSTFKKYFSYDEFKSPHSLLGVPEKATPYQILQIPKDASKEQIKQAYNKLALYWHPDLNKHNKAAKVFELITDARNQAMLFAKK